MWPSLKPSQRVALMAFIPPQSATVVQASGWVDVSKFENLLAVVNVGAMIATGTVDAKLRQATSSGGAGVKDITGAAISQILAASGGDVQALINLNAAQLDTNDGFTFVELTVTPATEAALIAGEIWGFDPKIAPPTEPAAVVQVDD